MSSKHTLEQLVGISKDLFKTASLNDAFIEFASKKLSMKTVKSFCYFV